MNSFSFSELEAGEELVFGPVTSTKTVSMSGSGGAPGQEGSLSHTSGRTVGVTNRRVIIEDLASPAKTQIVLNADVRRVFVKRRQQQGQSFIDLVRVQTVSGQNLKLDIKRLPAQAEAMLQTTFPQAEIVQGKGGAGGKVVLIVAAALFFLACVLPVLILLLLKLFAQ